MKLKITCSRCGQVRRYESSEGDPGCPCPPVEKKMSESEAAAFERGVEAIEVAKSILECVDELPEQAEDFGLSISEKARDILSSVETRGTATEKQLTALQNMLSGVRKWLR